ncbi:MAG: LysE family translocator [Desulfovibrio sp.]
MSEQFIPFLAFVLVMTSTPGMGNLSMLAVGQSVGFARALPFLVGCTTGFVCLGTLVALGLGGVFAASPGARLVLRAVGTAYILYLGVKILRMQLAKPDADRRFGFIEGLVLHPLNPKSWAMFVVGFSQFTDPSQPLAIQAMIFVGTFVIFQISFHSLWGLAGAGVLRWLGRGRALLAVNGALVSVMVGATLYALFL